MANKSHEKGQKQQFILLSSEEKNPEPDLHCWIKQSSATLLPGDTSLHYDEPGHCSLIWAEHTHHSAARSRKSHQICIYPQLNIVPNQYNIYASFRKV